LMKENKKTTKKKESSKRGGPVFYPPVRQAQAGEKQVGAPRGPAVNKWPSGEIIGKAEWGRRPTLPKSEQPGPTGGPRDRQTVQTKKNKHKGLTHSQ